MAETKNLCALIPLDLHNRVTEAREALGQTTSDYITNLLTEYFEMKKNGGKETMATNSRTMAFQISEEFFQRIKAHLDRESARLGRKVTQREFVLGLIEEVLETAERQLREETPEAANVAACEAPAGQDGPSPRRKVKPAQGLGTGPREAKSNRTSQRQTAREGALRDQGTLPGCFFVFWHK